MKLKSILPIAASASVALLIIVITVVMNVNDRASLTAKSDQSPTSNAAAIAKQVFPKDKVIDVKITLDEADFQDMLNNASAEEMKPASVEYNGIKLDHVGVRTKGNLSLRSVVNSESERYSLKLSFDEYISSQKLFGISKINLNNNYSDASYMREFLSYELAENMGLPTPGYSYVNVYINDQLWGFYLAVEQIDESYLERNFGNSYGALYKAEFSGTGTDLIWRDNMADSYSGLVLKSETANVDVLTDMIDELNNGTNYEGVLDVEEVLRYIALNVVTVNWDSYLGSNKQNYYLYENDGIFSILPWDYNMAFGGGPGGSSVLIDEPTQGAVTERPLIAKLLAVDKYKSTYHSIIRDALNGYLSVSHFSARVAELQTLISNYVKQDPSAFYTYQQYESGVTQLISFNSSTTQQLSQQLDGTIASSSDGSGSGDGRGGGMGNRKDQGQERTQAGAKDATAVSARSQAQLPKTPPDGMEMERPIPGNGGNWGGFGDLVGAGMGNPMEGRPARGNTTSQGNVNEMIVIGSALIVLALSSVFIVCYKRKRL